MHFQCEPSMLLNIDGLNLKSCKIFALEWRMSEGSELELKYEQFIAGESLRSLTSMSIKFKKIIIMKKIVISRIFLEIMRYYVLLLFSKIPKIDKEKKRKNEIILKPIIVSIIITGHFCKLYVSKYSLCS